jgi:predicted Fe-Mo cluster-binding NifX family protein
MRAAFAVWNGRIAPVFDVARQIHVVETSDGQILGETWAVLADDQPAQRAARLSALGIDTLVCGAISRLLKDVIASSGVKVVSFVSGESREVVHAWLNGELPSGLFAMPGCGPQRRRRRVRAGRGLCAKERPRRNRHASR